jgi:hypothetical protein
MNALSRIFAMLFSGFWTLAGVAWLTILPTIGLLYVIGYIH